MNILRSILAVLAGFITVVALSMGADWVFETTGFLPYLSTIGTGGFLMLLFALFYRTVFTVGAGALVAMLAPNHPMRHVNVLGFLGTLGGIAGVIAGWDLSAHWYPIALAVLAFPTVWLGGKLYMHKKRSADVV